MELSVAFNHSQSLSSTISNIISELAYVGEDEGQMVDLRDGSLVALLEGVIPERNANLI